MPSTADADASAGTSRGRSVDGRRTDTRERLVTEAAILFGAKGYGATSVADLESSVGLTPGSGGLYRHFASKQELLLATLSAYRDRVRLVRSGVAAEFGDADGPGDPATELRRIVEVLTDFMSGEQPIISIGADVAGLPAAAKAVMGEAWDDGYGIFADLFVRYGDDNETAAVHAVAALGSLYHYIAYLGSLGHEPAAVPLERFVASWITHWSAIAETRQIA